MEILCYFCCREIILFTYPIAVYFGLNKFGLQTIGIVLAIIFAVRILPAARQKSKRLKHLAWISGSAGIVLLTLGFSASSAGWLTYYPVMLIFACWLYCFKPMATTNDYRTSCSPSRAWASTKWHWLHQKNHQSHRLLVLHYQRLYCFLPASTARSMDPIQWLTQLSVCRGALCEMGSKTAHSSELNCYDPKPYLTSLSELLSQNKSPWIWLSALTTMVRLRNRLNDDLSQLVHLLSLLPPFQRGLRFVPKIATYFR